MDQLSTQTSENVLSLLSGGTQSKFSDNKSLATVTSAGSYLPYIQVAGGNTKEVKRGQFPIGHFSMTKNKAMTDLGDNFVALLLSWRPKAMQFRPDVMSFYNPESKGFKDIKDRMDEKDSGRACGVEFLLWLPEQKEFALFFFGNKTLRREAPNAVAMIQNQQYAARFRVQLIEDKKNNRDWHSAVVSNYDLPVVNLPTADNLNAVRTTFNNPPEQDVEPVESDTDEGRG